MIIFDTLVISYLPAGTIFQILGSVTLISPIIIGMYTIANFKRVDFRFSLLNALICIPYVFLLVEYLIWSGWIRIIVNIMIVVSSTVGIYAYLSLKSNLNHKKAS
ncbi:hypothetical protein [Lactobacillus mulieris]|uniref:hypothetical protein n=1 Tax=Lactobacillus mulieris TaxID=2508708 RepID=UPI0022AC8D1D|nr:hypothetical protein [Lactobacillus mulieris]